MHVSVYENDASPRLCQHNRQVGGGCALSLAHRRAGDEECAELCLIWYGGQDVASQQPVTLRESTGGWIAQAGSGFRAGHQPQCGQTGGEGDALAVAQGVVGIFRGGGRSAGQQQTGNHGQEGNQRSVWPNRVLRRHGWLDDRQRVHSARLDHLQVLIAPQRLRMHRLELALLCLQKRDVGVALRRGRLSPQLVQLMRSRHDIVLESVHQLAEAVTTAGETGRLDLLVLRDEHLRDGVRKSGCQRWIGMLDRDTQQLGIGDASRVHSIEQVTHRKWQVELICGFGEYRPGSHGFRVGLRQLLGAQELIGAAAVGDHSLSDQQCHCRFVHWRKLPNHTVSGQAAKQRADQQQQEPTLYEAKRGVCWHGQLPGWAREPRHRRYAPMPMAVRPARANSQGRSSGAGPPPVFGSTIGRDWAPPTSPDRAWAPPTSMVWGWAPLTFPGAVWPPSTAAGRTWTPPTSTVAPLGAGC